MLQGREDKVNGEILAKVSKWAVLVLAKDHIQRLEKSRNELQGDQSSLQDDVHDMKDAWLHCGGMDTR